MHTWSIVVPVKGTSGAKSRFGPDDNSALALAMALDTVDAALQVAPVIVVTNVVVNSAVNSAVLNDFSALGATVVADPGGGLDAAIDAGLAVAARVNPHGNIAVLLGDLPGVRADELAAALEAAAEYSLAIVADADAAGTTLATATEGHPHRLAFGANSRRRHLDAGYLELDGAWPGLRRDIDNPGHLDGLTLGPRTAALLGR